MIAYAICGTPRTGGNLLCSLLRACRRGEPDEYLHPVKYRERAALWSWRPDYFGIKVHWGERCQQGARTVRCWRELLPPDAEHRWIFQWREDVAAQARSWCVADATGDWYVPTRETVSVPVDLIARRARTVRRHNRCWERWFRTHGVEPLTVRFEDLTARPGRELDRVLEHLT